MYDGYFAWKLVLLSIIRSVMFLVGNAHPTFTKIYYLIKSKFYLTVEINYV
ncbi:hypothetical protein NIES23_19800 [Trichormus variabilis NIES-23]|uniref:Uncharacterized protein n=1 Tax=Trichormus variabilis NIES-23 TaxID=1973479 RepID=A0A1Z4KJQ6_ANAVA|nr:asl3560 [Nostoc sp. PCC 7120 = FACHB-418]BAY69187.1 hypothetical protein NIES23_19800 [Trichormus variabilis NIES-23]